MQPTDAALLETFATLEDLQSFAQGRRDPAIARPVPVSRITSYARREGHITDLNLEKILRSDTRARAIYMQVMRGSARACAPQAAAASGAELRERIVEGHKIELITEDARDYLVVHLDSADTKVRRLEVRDPEGEGGRVDFGEPIDGVLQAWLDPQNPEMLAVRRAITSPLAAIYLL